MRFASVVLVAAVVAVQFTATAPAASQENADGQQVASDETNFKLPKLFDFEHYKRLFHKSYSGPGEQMLRSKLFMSRAMRAFISATKYRYNQASYYLGINHMSDWSRAELARLRNWVLEAERASEASAAGATNGSAPVADLPQFMPADDEDALEVLRRVLAEHEGEPAVAVMRAQLDAAAERHARKRRDVSPHDDDDDAQSDGLRDLSLDDLINSSSSPPRNGSGITKRAELPPS